MSEVGRSGMRYRVVRMLRSLDAIAVENPVYPGTPDVNYVEGWIELKWLRAWPKRESTKVKVSKFSQEQRIFHEKRRRAGGNSWFLLQVRRNWILLDGAVAAKVVGHCTREELLSYAHTIWLNGVNSEELIRCISQRERGCSSTESDKR